MTTGVLAIAIVLVGWFSMRYGWWLPAANSRKPRILMYHMISEPPPGAKFRGLRVSPTAFRKQLQYLSETGWTFVTMSELMASQNTPGQKLVAITFDDGYEDNFSNALPILKEFNAAATLYLVVDRHNRDWSTAKKSHHNTGELAREPKLTDDQVLTMLESGLIELGAHTHTHPNLPRCDDSTREKEIIDCRHALQQRFGVEVRSFAYPFGIYEEKDIGLARAAGYTNAVTVAEGVEAYPFEHPFELRRVKISGKEGMLGFRMRIRRGIRGVRP